MGCFPSIPLRPLYGVRMLNNPILLNSGVQEKERSLWYNLVIGYFVYPLIK